MHGYYSVDGCKVYRDKLKFKINILKQSTYQQKVYMAKLNTKTQKQKIKTTRSDMKIVKENESDGGMK